MDPGPGARAAPIALTVGDPAGIGPEVVCAGLARLAPAGRRGLVAVGDRGSLARAARLLGADPFAGPGAVPVVDTGRPAGDVPDAVPSAPGGAAAHAAVVRAVAMARAGEAAAVVTAPLSKEALHLAGHKHDGHTGLIAHLCGVADPFMMLAAPGFAVVHVTAHLPLADALARVREERILAALRAGAAHLVRTGVARPRVAVAGLNPHAGEGGILGSEDGERIAPAVRRAAAEGIDVAGPLPPDTVFRDAHAGRYDLVVAQYHDQGHIPTKLVAFDSAVNVTLGLPVDRVSVDHGTAFDIAWKGAARPDNLLAALAYARRLAAGGPPPIVAARPADRETADA